jgi:hypothetical protein
MLQIVASLIDAARGIIYDRHMFIVQATAWHFNHLSKCLPFILFLKIVVIFACFTFVSSVLNLIYSKQLVLLYLYLKYYRHL